MNCDTIFSLEIFITFPVVSILTSMVLFTYLMFKEEFESTKSKLYVIVFIFVNWIPALGFGLEVSTHGEKFERVGLVCHFKDYDIMYGSITALTGLFQFYFYLIMFFLYRKLRILKSSATGDADLIASIFKKIGIQFVCGFLYSLVMWLYVFSRRSNWLDQKYYYFVGVLYNLSIPALCFVFIWSSNLRNAISQIPGFGWLGERQNSSEEAMV